MVSTFPSEYLAFYYVTLTLCLGALKKKKKKKSTTSWIAISNKRLWANFQVFSQWLIILRI